MLTARLQIVLAALCFATTGTAQALGPAGTTPVGVGAARILVGGVILVAVAAARGTATGGRWAAAQARHVSTRAHEPPRPRTPRLRNGP